ncbi:hypothetical protein RHMOL_Rhmol07G0248000 [Rhododendron molle]|uniref:Uncharacterized protein n=1 Tax=Rhododendron molle TaxID=49168 RepID=A0ACC0N644_RHOML|nr:hypothetical protein RHMOL_Rhmol07G0248000 [Rhododendron molle]
MGVLLSFCLARVSGHLSPSDAVAGFVIHLREEFPEDFDRIATEEDAICLAFFRDAPKLCNVLMRQLPRNHGYMKGSGGIPLLGEQAAEESKQAIAASLKGFYLVFITASAPSAVVNQQKSQNQQKELDNPIVGYVYFAAKYILVKVAEHMQMDSFGAADASMLLSKRGGSKVNVFEEEFKNNGRQGSKTTRFDETPLNTTKQRAVVAKQYV